MTTSSLLYIFDPKIPQDVLRIMQLREQGYFYVDTYDEQLMELAQIRNPGSIGKVVAPILDEPGEYVVEYPWRKSLVRIVGPKAYRELRTNRNRDLLTQEEQNRFAASCIGFAGLNVGNPGAVCIALEGGSFSMKLADFDPLSLTNLNRFRAGLPDLGVNKALLTARQILEIDPYYEIELYEKGISFESEDLFISEPKISLLIEEMDALPLKISIRETARRHRIPVVMVTGNGEGVLLDVERYDLDSNLSLLNNMLEAGVLEAITTNSEPLTPIKKVALARDFMGTAHLDERLIQSFAKFGTELVGIPQLAESSFMRGAALCYAAKAIILGRPLPSGRYSFSFSDHMKSTSS